MAAPPPSRLLPPHAARAIGAIFLLVLALGFVSSLIAMSRVGHPEDAALLDGTWTAAVEQRFDREQPFRQTAIDVWGVLEYALFREGGEGVLIGDAGWLYTTEEFLWPPGSDDELARKLAYIAEVRDRLAASGTELVVALLPAKTRIYPEHLGRYRAPRAVEDRYARFRRALVDAGVHAPDLAAALWEAKVEGAVFLRTDTHWTPEGAQVVADVLAAYTTRERLLPSQGGTDYRLRPLGSSPHRGDLLGFLPLGALEGRWGPEPDTLSLVDLDTAEVEADASALFGEVTIPLVLVGTSYSANPLWSFEMALKGALGADVLNLADEGLGPTVPMANYLDDPDLSGPPPELVIWEIPERFLGVSYEVP